MSPPKKEKKKKGNVKFNSPANQVMILSNDSDKLNARLSEKVSKIEKLPQCNGNNFPCSYGVMTFDNMKEFADYHQLKTKNRGTARNDVVRQIKLAGKYRQYIPQENRLYDLDTGNIYDVAAYKLPATRRRRTQKGGKTRRR